MKDPEVRSQNDSRLGADLWIDRTGDAFTVAEWPLNYTGMTRRFQPASLSLRAR